MAKKDVSDIVSGAGFVAHLVNDLVAAVYERGGTDNDIHRLVTPDGKETLGKIADLVVRRRSYPVEGEVFTLTLDADAPGCDPLAMVCGDGYNPAGWKYTGEKLTGVHARSFKLVSVDCCRDLEEVWQKLAVHGAPAPGQWREAFKKAYPTPDGKCPIGFPDPSWVDSFGCRRFPFVWSNGKSDFFWAGRWRLGVWLWLVAFSE